MKSAARHDANDADRAPPIRVDWSGKPHADFMNAKLNQPEWLPEFLGIPQPDRRSLAEITGLVVRIEE